MDLPEPAYGPSWGPIFGGLCTRCRNAFLDEAAIADFVVRGLREEGFTVEHAKDGDSAWHELHTSSWDVVLLDWNMPVMSGMEFLKMLRQRGHADQPKVVFCTTENDMAHIRAALEAGADEYVMKPFDRETLHIKLQLVGVA